MGSSGSVSYPGPSQAEQNLQSEQAQALRTQSEVAARQQKLADMLAPVLLQQAGLIPNYDANGNLVSVTQRPDLVSYQQQQQDLSLRQYQAQVAALNAQQPLYDQQSAYNLNAIAAQNQLLPQQLAYNQNVLAAQNQQMAAQGQLLPQEQQYNQNVLAQQNQQLGLQGQLIPYELAQAQFQNAQLPLQQSMNNLTLSQAQQAANYQNDLANYERQVMPISLEQLQAQLPMAQQQLAMQQQALNANLGAQQQGIGLMNQQAAIAQRQADMEAQDYASQMTNRPAQLSDQALALGRLQTALQGNLPTDPGLLHRLDTEEQQLRNQYARQLGPGFETSTPFVQAMDQFSRYKSDTIEASRRADITQATQVQGSLLPAQFRMNQSVQGGLPGVSTSGGSGSLSASPSAVPMVSLGSLSGGAAVPNATSGGTGGLIGLSGGGVGQLGGMSQFGTTGSTGMTGTVANPFSNPTAALGVGNGAYSNLSNLMSGYQAALAPYTALQQGQYSAALANAQMGQQQTNQYLGYGTSLLGAGGQGLGTYLGATAGTGAGITGLGSTTLGLSGALAGSAAGAGSLGALTASAAGAGGAAALGAGAGAAGGLSTLELMGLAGAFSLAAI